MITSRLRSGAVVACALLLAACVAGGTPAAADDTTDPTLSIAFTPQSPTPGDTVTITATVTPGTNPDSTGLGVNCNLSWAGLGSSAALNPDATGLVFSRDVVVPSNAVPGERVGSCTVSDEQERSSFTPYSLTIASAAGNQPPTVSAGGPYAVDEGGSVQLTANGSDLEGGILAYAWDLDDNGTFETSGQTVSFAADDGPATPDVAVRVRDAGGLTATAATTVTVANVAPTATFTVPASADAGFPFALSLTSPQDASAADTTAGFTYAFDCGSGYGAFGSASTASCPTSDVGTRSVGGKIRDKDGDVTQYGASVVVTVNFSSLCDLVRSYATDPKVADDLCAKLAQAEAAASATAGDGVLGAFRNQVDAKVGKGLTADQAAELKLLSMRL